jgi:ABC-type thiamin/hydroxymethylpyrimidine transport system permease subunit
MSFAAKALLIFSVFSLAFSSLYTLITHRQIINDTLLHVLALGAAFSLIYIALDKGQSKGHFLPRKF